MVNDQTLAFVKTLDPGEHPNSKRKLIPPGMVFRVLTHLHNMELYSGS